MVQLVTIQDKAVLEELLTRGIYHAPERNEHISDALKKAYEYMRNFYGYTHPPIFACVQGLPCEFGGAKTENAVAIQMEVPVTEVKLQEYYDWNDLVYYLDSPEEWTGQISLAEFCRQCLSEGVVDKAGVYQATLQVLKKEWIVKTADIPPALIQQHFWSGGNHILRDIADYA